MADTFIDIGQLFARAFGFDPPEGFSIEKAPDPDTTSSLGQPYYADDAFGREVFIPVKLKGYSLHFPVISCNRRTRVISTDMPERGGEVNEYISAESYTITVQGIIVRPDNKYPEAEIKELTDLANLGEAMEMRSVLTDIWLNGSDKVILIDIQWPAMPGVQNAKAYTLTFKTDSIFELEID